MERIGHVLARLGLDPVSLAARGHDGAHKLGSGLTREEPINPLETLDSREGPERNKGTGTVEVPASVTTGDSRRTDDSRRFLTLVSVKDMGRANPTRTPRAARPISLRLVHAHDTAQNSSVVSANVIMMA